MTERDALIERLKARNALRKEGWTVAVHNEYRLGGKLHAFWLFTHPNGRWIKAEGPVEDEASFLAALASASPAQGPEDVLDWEAAARSTLSYAAGILAEVGKGVNKSDEEDDWRECPICRGWVDHNGHDRTCRLRLSEAHIAGALSRPSALATLPPPEDERVGRLVDLLIRTTAYILRSPLTDALFDDINSALASYRGGK